MSLPYCIQEIEKVLTSVALPNPKFLASFSIGLLTCQKARFAKIAQSMPGNAKPESQEMRIRRYLDRPHVLFAPALAALLPVKSPWIIALDRTNWQRGETDVNLLTLAVVVGKTAVPLLWCELSHPGNSDTTQRIALIKQFVTLFASHCIRLITADREFIGEDWLAWLHEQRLCFLIRIRKNTLLTRPDGRCQEAFRYFEPRGDNCRNKKVPWDLWGTPVFVGGKRLKAEPTKDGKEDWLIVVSNMPSSDLLGLYRLRWSIETLFQSLKGRGFDLERCCTPRIELFLGLLALGFLWSLRTGMLLEETNPDKRLKHGRLPQSWFRRGMDYLHRLLVPLAGSPNKSDFERSILLLQPGFLPAKICL